MRRLLYGWLPTRAQLLCMLVLWTACGKAQRGEVVPIVAIEALRFPHESHIKVSCLACHSPSNQEQKRPAHASCDQAACHQAAFRGQPTEMCALCHEGLGETPTDPSPLLPYPPGSGTRSLPSTFSHRQHLDASTMEASLGFHISCIDCHQLQTSTSAGAMRSPAHADCARCHAAEAAPLGTPSMQDCVSCHRSDGPSSSRARDFITGDLHFSHRQHRIDRRGELISCASCHAESVQADASQAGKHAVPKMRVCVDCHDDTDRVPQTKRMRRCETCHSTRSAGLSAIAPRSHMPATERPENHTQAFRRDHADDARADANACGKCHTVLSGNRRDTCDECHQVMQPQDHVITWREYDHGPEAATDPERCTTCHQADFCVACHQTRPRSHFPALDFRSGGHGTQAILNMRACVACHQPSDDCTGSGCHRGESL